MRKIAIDPVTRIEGHARITIHVDDDGNVERTQFHVCLLYTSRRAGARGRSTGGGESPMSRIEDIGAFNIVREAGLAKLLPAAPRIAVGMGTCGPVSYTHLSYGKMKM